MSSRKWPRSTCVPLLLALFFPHGARAESDTVRIAQPYGLVYLPSYVAVDRHMIEDRAAAAGLGPIKVTLTRLASGPAGSDMMLAGDADLAMGGFGPALTLWDKTHGAQKVRGMMPLDSRPMFVVSTDPRIHGLKDFTDRIDRRQRDQGDRPGDHAGDGGGQGMGLGSAIPARSADRVDVEPGCARSPCWAA